MASEITIQISMQIKKTNLTYQNQPTAFKADMDADPKAATPGHVLASEQGTDVDLSKLTSPGWAIIRNLDDTNYVQIGVYNPDQSEFYPFARLYPGEHFALPLDPEINMEYAGTGTGTTGQLNTIRLLAANAPCNVSFEAFER